jgi:hypothetical protein
MEGGGGRGAERHEEGEWSAMGDRNAFADQMALKSAIMALIVVKVVVNGVDVH